MRAREVVLLVVLVLAAIGSWYVARSNKADESGPVTLEPQYRGYYLKSARILGTAADGKLLYEINADQAEQVDADTIQFSDVEIHYSPDSEVPWDLSADSATLQYDQMRVRLEGHVIARSARGFSGKDAEVRTEILVLDPESFVANTDERVQIRIGERSLTATGMTASLKDDRVQLKSNVRGTFVP